MKWLLAALILAQAAPNPPERPATGQERTQRDQKPAPHPPGYPRKMNF